LPTNAASEPPETDQPNPNSTCEPPENPPQKLLPAPPKGFADWLRENPHPSLEALITRFGSYDAITPDAWATYHQQVTDWNYRRMANIYGPAMWRALMLMSASMKKKIKKKYKKNKKIQTEMFDWAEKEQEEKAGEIK
jgi:hypothetical protein